MIESNRRGPRLIETLTAGLCVLLLVSLGGCAGARRSFKPPSAIRYIKWLAEHPSEQSQPKHQEYLARATLSLVRETRVEPEAILYVHGTWVLNSDEVGTDIERWDQALDSRRSSWGGQLGPSSEVQKTPVVSPNGAAVVLTRDERYRQCMETVKDPVLCYRQAYR